MTEESGPPPDPPAPEADVAAGPSAPASKSIYLYFGGGPASASNSAATLPSASVGESSQPKKRRKKGGQDENQARFLRNGGEGGWMIGKHDEATASCSEAGETVTTAGTGATRAKGTVRGRGTGTGTGMGTGRKAGGEEEAEVRDMVQRGRGGRRGGKSRRGQVGPRCGDAPTGSDGDEDDDPTAEIRAEAFDSSAIPGPEADSPSRGSSTPASPKTKPSPTKRKRGRPPKVLPEIPTPNETVINPPISSSAGVESTGSHHPDPPPIVHRSSSPSDIVFTGHLRPDRPDRPDRPEPGAHPFFSRTASSSGSNKGVSQADPIDVDVDVDEPVPAPLSSGHLEVPPATGSAPVAKPGPRKLAFASDARPAHTFFSRVAEASGAGTSRATSVVSETATEASVSVPGSGTESKGKKVHAFFRMNGQGKAGGLKDGWGGGVKEGKEWLVPWPGRIWPTHTGAEPVGPSQSRPPGPGLGTKHYPGPLDEDDFWTSHGAVGTSEAAPVASKPAPIEQSRLPVVGGHPAISSVKSRQHGSDRPTWCERYRPTRACEVLGNELEATYLRDWLSALTVGHKDGPGHGPRVSRKIKRRKAPAFDDWIVDDLGGYDNPHEEDSEDEDFEPIEDSPLIFAGRPSRYPPLEHRLGNAILLMGPQGSGKSAAVYAAAEELGWEVFEIYPGIGKRTGGNVMSWVGDVGKNHMVVTSKEVDKDKGGLEAKAQAQNGESDREKRNKGGLQSFFGRKADLSRELLGFGSQGSQAEPIEVDDDMEGQHVEQAGRAGHGRVTDGAKPGLGEVEGDENSFRQSVILLDEVDILFEEEGTFWPAVVSLIATSHRPVILTCNDPERVPLAQLPLQAILQFEPPASYLAIPYLEAIAEHEGLKQSDIPAVVEQCTSTPLELLDQPLPPNGHEPMPVFDLRRAIQQMQLDRVAAQSYSSASGAWRSRSRSDPTGDRYDDPNSLESLTRRLDTQSFVDAFVAERPWALMEISEVDRYSRTTDDVLDSSLLLKPEPKDWRPTLAAYDNAPTIASTLLQLAGEPLPSFGDLQTDRTEYIRSLLVLLDPIVPLSSPLLPRPSVFLDLLPVIRTMILTDDIFQGAEDAAVALGGERMNRKTGRPVRAVAGKGYERYLDLGEGALMVARTLGLIFEQDGAR